MYKLRDALYACWVGAQEGSIMSLLPDSPTRGSPWHPSSLPSLASSTSTGSPSASYAQLPSPEGTEPSITSLILLNNCLFNNSGKDMFTFLMLASECPLRAAMRMSCAASCQTPLRRETSKQRHAGCSTPCLGILLHHRHCMTITGMQMHCTCRAHSAHPTR